MGEGDEVAEEEIVERKISACQTYPSDSHRLSLRGPAR